MVIAVYGRVVEIPTHDVLNVGKWVCKVKQILIIC